MILRQEPCQDMSKSAGGSSSLRLYVLCGVVATDHFLQKQKMPTHSSLHTGTECSAVPPYFIGTDPSHANTLDAHNAGQRSLCEMVPLQKFPVQKTFCSETAPRQVHRLCGKSLSANLTARLSLCILLAQLLILFVAL